MNALVIVLVAIGSFSLGLAAALVLVAADWASAAASWERLANGWQEHSRRAEQRPITDS